MASSTTKRPRESTVPEEPKAIRRPPPSDVLDRVKAFMPQIAAANAVLEKVISEKGQKAVDIEHVEDTEEHYIEMNLGMGVLEQQPEINEDTIVIPTSGSKSTKKATAIQVLSSTSVDEEEDEDL